MSNFNKLRRKIKILIAIASFVVIASLSVIYIFGKIQKTSVRGEFEISTKELDATTEYTSSEDQFSWTYTKAGDVKTINVKTINSSDSVLHNTYYITADNTNNDLYKAILVYYNGAFIGPLNKVISENIKIDELYSYIPLTGQKTDTFELELHQAAKSSSLDNKTISITLNTYTENANYSNYMYVHNESEFKKAVDDVNSGLLEDSSIVFCNSMTLASTYIIKNPVTLYTSSYTVSGSITLNDNETTSPNALIKVFGDTKSNLNITVGSYYDQAAAKQLQIDYSSSKLEKGINSGDQVDIVGPYSFYGISIGTANNCTFTSPNVIIANTVDEYYTRVASIKVDNEVIKFKAYGSKTSLIAQTLAHMPGVNDVITTDLFLPTFIPGENSSIRWSSSNTSIISNDGRIAATRIENETVTLYAEIKVNNKTYTEKFTFKISAHTNEINFYKLVQEISPIVINNIYNDASDADDALYFLPIVNNYSDYDYRIAYATPTSTQKFDWQGYTDIGLENITYSMTAEQIEAYPYITAADENLGRNTLYLNATTMNNYATITITGDFGNNETYSTDIKISIAVGADTQLLEKVFSQVSDNLEEVSILGNILETRLSSGMSLEKGDFTLDGKFYDESNNIDSNYVIEFSKQTTVKIINDITYDSEEQTYTFLINPEYFNEYETSVPFIATVYYKKGTESQLSKSRTFYVTAPAALHLKDYGTISIYNSLKYQTYTSLPSNEQGRSSGYSISGSVLTDSNIDYVLLRDIVGDELYLSEYNANPIYLNQINYTSSNYAPGVKNVTLAVNTTNNTSATDTVAYDFVKLIEWATNDKKVLASSVVSSSNVAALGSFSSIKSNGKDYLNDDEINVLKLFYKYYTGASENDWNTIYAEILDRAPGYIFTEVTLLNSVLSCVKAEGISFAPGNFSTTFGKYMEILQRYAVSTTRVNANNVAPCQEQYNNMDAWYHSDNLANTFTLYDNYDNAYTATTSSYIQIHDGSYWLCASNPLARSEGDGNIGGLYATKYYAADMTSYITEAELTVLKIFLLNCLQSAGRTKVFADAQRITINSILTNSLYSDYYNGYRYDEDFNTCGKAILNAFEACMEIPTYFSTDGVSKLISYFYTNFNNNGTTYKIKSYDNTSTSTFKSILNDGKPYVTNLDNLKNTLSYFINLESLIIKGNPNLSIFLSENGLAVVYARASLNNKKINRLEMNYCANAYTNFDLANISNFNSLTYLNLANNKGIQSVNELVNVNRSKYTYVNIQNIGIDFEYQEFAIDNIASATCSVYYTDAGNESRVSNDSSKASMLADLEDFNKFITKYMFMTNVVYNEDGTTSTVTWRIDEGNEIQGGLTSYGGKYPKITTIDEMNQLVSPYYYCNASFDYTTGSQTLSFTVKHFYKVYYEGGLLKNTDLGVYDSITDITNLDTSIFDSITEPAVIPYFVPDSETTTSKNVINAGTSTYSDRTDWFTNGNQTNLTKNGSFDYLLYSNEIDVSSNRKNDFTLPTQDEIDSIVQEQLASYNPRNLTYSITFTVQSKNYNGNNNNSLGDAWQHGLIIDGTVFDYSRDSQYYGQIVYGGNTFTFNTLDSNYAGRTISLRYWNNNNKTNYYLYPIASWYGYGGSWQSNIKQSFYKITMTVNYSYNYDDIKTIEINYVDGTTETISGVYAAGWRIKKSTNATIEYTVTESTLVAAIPASDSAKYLYYDGNNVTIKDSFGNDVTYKNGTLLYVVPEYVFEQNSRTGVYRLVGTIYVWELWYTTTRDNYNNFTRNNQRYFPENNNAVRDGETIDYLIVDGVMYTSSELMQQVRNRYTNTVTRQNISGYDVDWETNPLTTTYVIKVGLYPYYSHVKDISSSDYSRLSKQTNYYKVLDNNINLIFIYTGTTGTEKVYEGSTYGVDTSYTQNYGYRLNISNKQLSWTLYSDSITDPTDDMDAILATANTHFKDNQYGYWYGRYYGYGGESIYTALGNVYEQNYIYRIMPNSTNTAFEWQKIQLYKTNSNSGLLQDLGIGVAQVGDIYYTTGGNAFSDFFKSGWYKIVIDEKTNIVNLVKFNDIGFTAGSNYTRLNNDKMVARSGDYLGYSGTFTVQISALIRIFNADGTTTEYIKTYKLRFVGSLYKEGNTLYN